MKKRGEITVFLSLTLVCILSLFMGLLESARTAGARLYLTMAANSAMASVMSQYNRNLWDMYHLLFLEYESPEAIGRSFDTYLDFYLEQENLYPMKRKSREVTAILNMQDHAGKPLEDGILSYVRYRLPDIAGQQPPIHDKGRLHHCFFRCLPQIRWCSGPVRFLRQKADNAVMLQNCRLKLV